MSIQPGKLSRLITIRRRTEERDAAGDAQYTWADLMQRWASIEPLTARELRAGDQVQSLVTHRVRMRYTNLIRHSDRIAWNGRTYEIAGITDDGRNVETVLLLTERVD